ncbi:MAG: SMI1/KNR4 family protein [Paludibacteraceae bacterium]|nr:SMI1/KNR4 family protein [Paludibacteraceae bacterium]
MKQNIIDVINSLGENDELYSVGEVDPSKIVEAAETLGVKFAKDFVEYTQKFGSISVGSMELCGIDDEWNCSTVDQTQEMRELYPNFPKDCYVIENLGIDDAVAVQKSDGKVYQFAEGYEELEFLADSLGEYLLAGNEKRDERSEFWKSQSN